MAYSFWTLPTCLPQPVELGHLFGRWVKAPFGLLVVNKGSSIEIKKVYTYFS